VEWFGCCACGFALSFDLFLVRGLVLGSRGVRGVGKWGGREDVILMGRGCEIAKLELVLRKGRRRDYVM